MASSSAISGELTDSWRFDPSLIARSCGLEKVQPRPALFVFVSHAASVKQVMTWEFSPRVRMFSVERGMARMFFCCDPCAKVHSLASLRAFDAVSCTEIARPSNTAVFRAVHRAHKTHGMILFETPDGGRQVAFLSFRSDMQRSSSVAM